MSTPRYLAFWSYQRDDDHEKLERSRLTKLRTRLEHEVQRQTGKRARLFQDRFSIEPGELWEQRIDDALRASASLVAITTPSYLRSGNCRNEVHRYLELAGAEQETRRLIPILYIDVMHLADLTEAEADMRTLLASHQWLDWRDVRISSVQSQRTNQKLAELASLLTSDGRGPDTAHTGVQPIPAARSLHVQPPTGPPSDRLVRAIDDHQTATVLAFPSPILGRPRATTVSAASQRLLDALHRMRFEADDWTTLSIQTGPALREIDEYLDSGPDAEPTLIRLLDELRSGIRAALPRSSTTLNIRRACSTARWQRNRAIRLLDPGSRPDL